MPKDDPIVIVSAARTPMGSFNGNFRSIPAIQLGAAAISGALNKAKIKPEQIQEVLMGCVLPAGLGQAPARQAAIVSGIPNSTPCTTINKVCGSGMKAVMLAHDEIIAGSNEVILAGGMENMTQAPYLLPRARTGYRIGHAFTLDHLMVDGLEDAYQRGRSMGTFAEASAKEHQLSREEQDEYARISVERAKAATVDGSFADEIMPITITTTEGKTTIGKDEGPLRADPAKIPQLRPAFKKGGTITAANSSSISDGAAALIITKKSVAKKLKVKPLATIIGHYTHAQAPEQFTTAPIGAIQGLLKKIDWDIKDVDLFEINEAFAVVPILAMKKLKISHGKLNIYGGACVMGHPIGASGARIIVTLINALRKKNLKRGIAALCIGGGEATAIAIEI